MNSTQPDILHDSSSHKTLLLSQSLFLLQPHEATKRSGTHDGGLIPAMYNSPTAGTEHVHLHGHDRRQASLNHWHPMLVMCHSTNSAGGWLWLVSVCLARWEKYVKLYIVVVSVVGMGSNGKFQFGCGSKLEKNTCHTNSLKRFDEGFKTGFRFD